MFGYMRCIKTGCDVKCENYIFHGDLFYQKGYLVLAGVPKTYDNVDEHSHIDFEINEMFEIPASGNYYTSFVLTGEISNVNDELLDMFKQYETEEIIKKFSK